MMRRLNRKFIETHTTHVLQSGFSVKRTPDRTPAIGMAQITSYFFTLNLCNNSIWYQYYLGYLVKIIILNILYHKFDFDSKFEDMINKFKYFVIVVLYFNQNVEHTVN